MNYQGKDHTYVICAYKESEYLEECIRSLMNQTVEGNVIVVTSTPNAFIHKLADKYRLPLYVNEGEKGIAGDWNFGLSKVTTAIATIAHQDDTYEPWYREKVLRYMNESPRPLLFFSDYGEIRNGKRQDKNRLLQIKRMMLLPMRFKSAKSSVFIRRRVLSFGSAISCPTVSYCLENLPQPIFQSGYRSCLDWQAWEKISRMEGDFIYCDRICMYHRIHEESTTSEVLQENERYREDLEMFMRFWPKPVAHFLEFFYKNSEKSNQVG